MELVKNAETVKFKNTPYIESENSDTTGQNRAAYNRVLAETAIKNTSLETVDELMLPTGPLTRSEFEKVQALAMVIENDGRCLDALPEDISDFAASYGLDQPPQAFVEWLDRTDEAKAHATVSELARAMRYSIKAVIPADIPVAGIGAISFVAVVIIAKIVDNYCNPAGEAVKGVHSEFNTIYEDLSPEADSKL